MRARSPRRSVAWLICLASLVLPPGLLAEGSESWTRWGGATEDFRAEVGEITEAWGDVGPARLWTRELGDGYSTILVEDGRLYTQYRAGEQEAVIAMKASDGSTVWEHRYDHSPREGHVAQFGIGPRSTPLIVGDRIYTIGIAGRMFSLNKSDGKPVWSHDLWDEAFGGNVLPHGYSSSPLEVGDTVVALVGGDDAGVIAFAKDDGAVVWKSEGFANSYGTPRLLKVHGKDQIVTFMAQEVIGLDPETGKTLWTFSHGNQFGQNISPPVLHDGRYLFISSPQAGSYGLELVPAEDGSFDVKTRWSTKKVQFYHVTNVVDGDWVYGSSGMRSPAFLSAINARTGEVAWRKRGFAKANVVGAGDHLMVLDEDGQLGLATATPDDLTVHARVQLLEQVAWTAPTIVASTMYLRDTRSIMALDLSRAPSEATRPVAVNAEAEETGGDAGLGDPPADASEGLKIMYRVDAAARAVSSVRMKGSVRATGSAKAFTWVVDGEAILEGWNGSGASRFSTSVEGSMEGRGTRTLTGGGDGNVYYLVDHATKKAYVDMDPQMLGSAAGAIRGFGMVEFVHPTPFSDEVGAEVVELRGSALVGEVDCHEVFVDYGQGRGQSTWFVSKEDFLPRKRIRHVTDRDGVEGTVEITLTELEVAPELSQSTFSLEVPEGYELIEDFAP